MKIILVSVFLFLCSIVTTAEDVGVVIQESLLNKFLKSVGPVSESGKTKVMGNSLDYRWTVENPSIQIRPEGAVFRSDVQIKSNIINYKTEATGSVDIDYDPEKNEVKIQVKKASFELYAKVFGKKIRINDIDISKVYNPEFAFAGPEPIQSQIEVELPGGKKLLALSTGDPELLLEEGKITVRSKVEFSEIIPTPSSTL